MPRRKRKIKTRYVQGDILKFDAAAKARGMTYGQAQIQETCRNYQHMRQIPAHYRKAGIRF